MDQSPIENKKAVADESVCIVLLGDSLQMKLVQSVKGKPVDEAKVNTLAQ